MKYKYTKRDRELAIRVCQAAWQSWRNLAEVYREWFAISRGAVPLQGPVWGLVAGAWQAVGACRGFLPGQDGYYDGCIEAECLLRDGWSPGDPVVRLGGEP